MLARAAAGPRADPWRRTSGIHRVRTRRQLAVVRALWEARDAHRPGPRHRARPGAAGRRDHRRRDRRPRTSEADLGQAARLGRPLDPAPGRPQLWPTIQQRTRSPEAELPRPAAAGDGPPPPNRWPDRDPVAAARLARARAALTELSRAAQRPDREPAVARSGPPAGLVAAGVGRGRGAATSCSPAARGRGRSASPPRPGGRDGRPTGSTLVAIGVEEAEALMRGETGRGRRARLAA